MNRKYEDEHWENRLAPCNRVQVEDKHFAPEAGRRRVRERHYKYLDEHGNRRGFIIEYTHADGSVIKAVRMLRDGDTAYHAIPRP